MKHLQWLTEIAGVAALVVAGWWVYAPVGVALIGAYLVYLSWEGSSNADSD